MAGATAASAAAATSAQANSTVTLTLSNDFLSQTTNSLSANFFGNGPIFSFTGVANNSQPSVYRGSARLHIKTFFVNNGGGFAFASFYSGAEAEVAKVGIANRFGGQTSGSTYRGGTVSRMFTLPIRFSDPSVNGGAITDGTLKLTASAQGFTSARITLDSFTYTMLMANGVPESGSTLALLALGAGGVIAFRHRKKTA